MQLGHKDLPGLARHASQSPYGAKWFATGADWLPTGFVDWMSQSPYGAKWFATGDVWVPRWLVDALESQSPYGAKWFATKIWRNGNMALTSESQSPYGAKRFATLRPQRGSYGILAVAIPLRG